MHAYTRRVRRSTLIVSILVLFFTAALGWVDPDSPGRAQAAAPVEEREDSAEGGEAPGGRAEEAKARLAGRTGRVWVIPIRGTIDLGLASFASRAIEDAVAEGAVLVLLEINTFGGRVDAATEIRDRLIGSGLPTVAYIAERAWSAGALIALAADWIWMAEGASIGAAEPRPAEAKTVSALRAEFESMAERRGRRPDVAAAMVDASVVVEGLVEEGEILTLTTQKAIEFGYADGVAGSRGAVLAALGLDSNPVTVSEPNWGERLARFLTDPVVSQLLLTLGFLGLLAEVTSPGFGVPGAAGLLALALFFGARLFVGLVGWEVLGLFFLGIFLLILELFVVPGVGVAGAAGVLAILASLYFSFADAPTAVLSLGITSATTLIGGYLLWRAGKRFGTWNKLILSSRQSNEEGYVASKDLRAYEGRRGRALTVLRPAGTVVVGDDRLDAVTEGEFIPAGQEIVVVKVEGTRLVVRALV